MMRAGRVAVLVGSVLGGKSGVVVADDYNHKVCMCVYALVSGFLGCRRCGWLSVKCLYLAVLMGFCCVQY